MDRAFTVEARPRRSGPGWSSSAGTRGPVPAARHRAVPARPAAGGEVLEPRLAVLGRGRRHTRLRGARRLRGMVRSADNGVYNRMGGSWWDETSPLNVLHGSFTPGRFAYFRNVLAPQFGTGAAGMRVLDIGCGDGFLAEEFAALGCRVTGVDPSRASIDAARAHAAGRDVASTTLSEPARTCQGRTPPSTWPAAVTSSSTYLTWTG
jgi:hypothetical protein